MAVIELHHVNKYFGTGSARVHVLKDVDFAADQGQLNLVIGPSGSGKSTFLTIAGGLQTASSGTVRLAHNDLAALTPRKRDQLRLTQIGFVLQAYTLLPYLTVSEQLQLVDRTKPSGNLTAAQCHQLLEELDIASLINKYPHQLSGGQNQRVAIARALYPNPPIVLADEPTAALDSQRVQSVGKLLARLAHTHNKAVVVVTHDQRLTTFADHIYQITDGVMTKIK